MDVVTFLYLLVPIISAVGWLPQILRLARNPRLGVGLSPTTWGVWSFTGVISFWYAIVHLHDVLLISTLAINALGQLIIFFFLYLVELCRKKQNDSALSDSLPLRFVGERTCRPSGVVPSQRGFGRRTITRRRFRRGGCPQVGVSSRTRIVENGHHT